MVDNLMSDLYRETFAKLHNWSLKVMEGCGKQLVASRVVSHNIELKVPRMGLLNVVC
jgi:hypothetical protein